MRSYSETEVFSEDALWLLERARELVGAMPDPPQDAEPWRCHEVVRVVARRLVARRIGFELVDGKYGPVDHSWIEFVDGHRRVILDTYAVGSLPQVRLLDASGLLPHTACYRSGPQRDDIREDVIREIDRALPATVIGWRCACGELTTRTAQIGPHVLPECERCAAGVPLDQRKAVMT